MKTATKKKPIAFARWLDAQDRADLTHPGATRQGDGWTIEEFVRESEHRGIPARVGTAYHWRRGATPRPTTRERLEKEFAGIAF